MEGNDKKKTMKRDKHSNGSVYILNSILAVSCDCEKVELRM